MCYLPHIRAHTHARIYRVYIIYYIYTHTRQLQQVGLAEAILVDKAHKLVCQTLTLPICKVFSASPSDGCAKEQ